MDELFNIICKKDLKMFRVKEKRSQLFCEITSSIVIILQLQCIMHKAREVRSADLPQIK